MDEGDLAVDALDYGMQTEAGDDGDVRRDLGEAVDIIGRLRDENETFRANFEQLKAAHMQLQTRHAEVRKQLTEAVDANVRHAIFHPFFLQSQIKTKSRRDGSKQRTPRLCNTSKNSLRRENASAQSCVKR